MTRILFLTSFSSSVSFITHAAGGTVRTTRIVFLTIRVINPGVWLGYGGTAWSESSRNHPTTRILFLTVRAIRRLPGHGRRACF